MRISSTQREFLSVLDDAGPAGLLLYQISARIQRGIRQPTIDKLLRDGLMEYGDGRSYRVTDAGRAALSN
tara:strand:+ start:2215 stop:2424 length:210 start_codon:yes stop_codon:yes gene_type:complete